MIDDSRVHNGLDDCDLIYFDDEYTLVMKGCRDA